MANRTESSPDIDQLISEYESARINNDVASQAPVAGHGHPSTAGAALPPGKEKDIDQVLAEMKRVPLFMTSMDDVDDDNPQLEALKALAYEGTPAENADNFKAQGNELVQAKRWADAREFYTKALQALKMPRQPQDAEEGLPDVRIVQIDDAAEEKRERAIEEACYANRALCNLEMKNYGSCNRDCAGALRINPRNVKAWYRAASACLALDKVPEALDACEGGLKCEANNSALKLLLSKVEKRKDYLAELHEVRKHREEKTAKEQATLRYALKQRNIVTRDTAASPNLEDAVVALADPLDSESKLTFPVVLLYPLQAQSDFVKAFAEDESLAQHLEYVLPAPWDQEHEYTPQTVDCYIETMKGGLIKAGKNLSLSKLLSTGKVEVVDGVVKVSVVPKAKAAQWIEEFKQRRGKH